MKQSTHTEYYLRRFETGLYLGEQGQFSAEWNAAKPFQSDTDAILEMASMARNQDRPIKAEIIKVVTVFAY